MNGIILKSFVYENSGGNGAGLVIANSKLSEKQMMKIASDIGLSETAFVEVINVNEYNVRFFTPVCEVDLCGHATIAAFYYIGTHLISDRDKVATKVVTQHTSAGDLCVKIVYNGGKVEHVMMEQAKPVIYDKFDEKSIISIAQSLGLRFDDIGLEIQNFDCVDCDLVPHIVSTGLKDIIIPVKSRKLLNSMKPNYDMISDISKNMDVCGYHVFTIDDGQIYARNFAPSVGINEECATGTSNGALGALLNKYHIKTGDFYVLQGETMNELSKINVHIDDNNVYVGGIAKETGIIELSIQKNNSIKK